MSKVRKECTCIFCKKKLIGENRYICKRCKLAGKSVTEKAVGVGMVLLTVGAAVAKTTNDNKNK